MLLGVCQARAVLSRRPQGSWGAQRVSMGHDPWRVELGLGLVMVVVVGWCWLLNDSFAMVGRFVDVGWWVVNDAWWLLDGSCLEAVGGSVVVTINRLVIAMVDDQSQLQSQQRWQWLILQKRIDDDGDYRLMITWNIKNPSVVNHQYSYFQRNWDWLLLIFGYWWFFLLARHWHWWQWSTKKISMQHTDDCSAGIIGNVSGWGSRRWERTSGLPSLEL